MALYPDYLTADQLKHALTITDAGDDPELGFAITAASRAIDHHTGRQFGVLAEAEPRYYAAVRSRRRGRYTVEIDDLMTTDDLVVAVDDADDGTYERTLALGTDFRLEPANAAGDGRPWTRIVLSGVAVPTTDNAIRITALWGWTAVPTLVTQAALIQAARLFKRKDAPFGIAGSPELGSEMRLLAKVDPDVQMLLASVCRKWLVA